MARRMGSHCVGARGLPGCLRTPRRIPPVPLSIDVVLVVYNRYDLTESCLRHLAAQTREHRVIVVDNGSTDDTRERVKAEWPQHDLLWVDENQQLSKSTNLGARHGDGDVILW